MVEVRGLHRHFGSLKAVNDVSFRIDRGQVFGFIGPNGAGKTTTMRILATIDVPTQLTPVQEMQYAASWHGIVALALIVVVIAHIYIGTLGMQGAFQAMGSGQVDVNWAKEHHSLWAEREIQRMEDAAAAETGAVRVAPAE